MQRFCMGRFAVALAAGWLSLLGSASADSPRVPTNDSPRALVRAALESELAGPSAARGQLLAEAIERDPNFAPARWQAGYVKWDNRWLTNDEVAELAGRDQLRLDYRARRAVQDPATTDHRELARWCTAFGLAEEARLHWQKLLEQGDDAEATNALGLDEYEGRLLTPPQIEEQKRRSNAQRQAARRWKPIVAGWRDALLRGTPTQAEQTRHQLSALADPAAVPALRTYLLERGTKPLRWLFVETLGHVDGPLATSTLLQIAAWHESPPLRAAALAQLKQRPKYAVVPLLLASLEYPVDSSYSIEFTPDGGLLRNDKVVLRSWLDDYVVRVRHEVHSPSGRYGPAGAQRIATNLAHEAQQDHAKVARQAAMAQFNGARSLPLLAQVMDMRPVDDPGIWYRRWLQYREYDPPPYRPRQSYERLYRTHEYRNSCFPAGTPVTTLFGQRAIETTRTGDRVLAQDVETGELAYQLVYDVTLRTSQPLVQINLPGETIRATRGHPFWVDGQRWLMAKELSAGMVLHTLRGAVKIDSVASAHAEPVYNLVVGDFNTYFVGRLQVLVHDNMPPVEPTARVPGLALVRDN